MGFIVTSMNIYKEVFYCNHDSIVNWIWVMSTAYSEYGIILNRVLFNENIRYAYIIQVLGVFF